MSECIKRKVCINVSQKSRLDGPDDNIKKKDSSSLNKRKEYMKQCLNTFEAWRVCKG